MVAAIALVGLSIADAMLSRLDLGPVEIDLNPLVPPFTANVVARVLVAVAAILAAYLIRKRGLLWWLDFAVLGLMAYHTVGHYMASFH